MMWTGNALTVTAAVLLVLAAACASDSGQDAPDQHDAPEAKVVLDDHGEPAGLHRHHRWSDRIGQGAQPHGEIAFQNLAALGYTTVLSVDGSVPEVDLATKHGLRYVHVPIGYDGVTEQQSAHIIAAVERADGPVYVHCHHGKHRGPAAVMVARIAVENISNDDAVDALTVSGTSPKYEGLYRDVGKFKGVSAAARAAVPAELPAKVLPKGLRANMVGVDQRFGFLADSRGNEWKGVPDNPDVLPPHEARMLWELFRELRREPAAKKEGSAFLKFAEASESDAVALEKALRAADLDAADKHYKSLKKSCNACHAEYRN
ncbi:MAG: sulfur transferase domain-containing protein [Planctomycetota bacterium]|nr:sulfur transferase domain-containing protein [Planctomycetota bacterium]